MGAPQNGGAVWGRGVVYLEYGAVWGRGVVYLEYGAVYTDIGLCADACWLGCDARSWWRSASDKRLSCWPSKRQKRRPRAESQRLTQRPR